MPLDTDLLEDLCCPRCKGELTSHTKPEGYTCEACKLHYAVVEGIPNFLVKDAKPVQGTE